MTIAIPGEHTDTVPSRRRLAQIIEQHLELIEVLLLSIATILTAWAAFQSNQWGVRETDLSAIAAASRADAVRLSAEADVIADIDTELFLQWLDAFTEESALDTMVERDATGIYQPDPATLSGFLYGRFRDDMRVAFDAWIAERPLLEETSSGTPFDRPDYRIEQREQSAARQADADAQHIQARTADAHGARYVLLAVLLAWVMLFAGVSSKLSSRRSRVVAVGFAASLLLTAAVVLSLLPMSLS